MVSRSIARARRAATSAVIACLVASLFASGFACGGKPPAAPRPAVAADAALRIRIARLEAKRAGGLEELAELAARGAPPERLLALRALGRIGGTRALEALRGALGDGDSSVVAAAAGAIGVAASLDELDAATTAALGAALAGALPRAGARAPIVLEALGRAGDAGAQPLLAAGLVGEPARAEAAAIALGRHGRRKLPLSREARDALAAATQHRDAAVRYAAVWALGREALGREQLPGGAGGAGGADAAGGADVAGGADASLAAAIARLAARVGDDIPEIRAQVIAALARRRAAVGARREIESRLADPDWRVGVEAIRALAGGQSDGPTRAAAARLLAVRAAELARDERTAHVVIEGLRVLLANGDGERPEDAAEIAERALAMAKAAAALPAPLLSRGWIDCLARAVHARRVAPAALTAIERCGPREFPDHLRLPLLAELIKAKVAAPSARRAALDVLIASPDARVRAAGVGALAALWPDSDGAGRGALVAALIDAIGARDPILAGTAVDAAPSIYELIGGGDHAALDAAVIVRAAAERDVELGSSLLELIGKQKLAAGAPACRAAAGADSHPVRARAAAACLAALGEPAPPPPAARAAAAPPVDVAAVIGRAVRWTLSTTRGPIAIELRPDAAPWAVATIVALTRKGFYDGRAVHRVVPDYVAQGGDPTESGWGGPGFTIPAEPSDGTAPGFTAGGVGIADAGRDSGGSQWFIMHARAPHLDGRYTWIGRVVEGQAAADALQVGDRVLRATVDVAP
jgi:cyclophilin family peptidyl-prolyl cis-trans isomerase/HEAT repeat protein